MGISREAELLIASLGAFFLGAVYLGGLLAFGLVGNRFVFALALISAGLGYLVQIGSVIVPQYRASLIAMWMGSVLCAIAAGLVAIIGG